MTQLTKTGWFADVADVDADHRPRGWQPVLQLHGMCFSLDVWFDSEAKCEAFIVREVLECGMYDDPRVSSWPNPGLTRRVC